MTSDSFLQLVFRALPSVLVFVLGLLAANDLKTRRQWTQFLHQTGSLRADQREDETKQKSVKWPFFAVALVMLWWPISYYKVATRTFEISAESDIFKKVMPSATPAPTATPKPTPVGPTPPPPPAAPGQESNSSAVAPNQAPSAPAIAPRAAPAAAPNGSGAHL